MLSSPHILPKRENPEACHKDHQPKCDTQYDINPTPPDLEPYIGRNGLEHLLNHPHEAEDLGNNLPRQKVWLERFPKKEKTRLTVCPPYQYGLGWGIEFEEGFCFSRPLRIVVAALVIGALVFLICWWKLHNDLQAATSMAALLVSCATLVMSTFAFVASG